MIGGIVITHGGFASGLVNAVEMIAGKQTNLTAISLQEGEGLMDLMSRIQEAKTNMDVNEVILFVDMFGATPNNAACMFCSQTGDPVVAGVNLPLLLEFVIKRTDNKKEVLLEALEACSKQDFKIICQKDMT